MEKTPGGYVGRISILVGAGAALVFALQCARPLVGYAWKEQRTRSYLKDLNKTSADQLIFFAQETIRAHTRDHGRFTVTQAQLGVLSLPAGLPAPQRLSGDHKHLHLLIAKDQDSTSEIWIRELSGEWVIEGLVGEHTGKVKQYHPRK